MIAGIEQRHLVTRDGTRIGYQVRGASGPCVVLANGLGGTYLAFRSLYGALEGYRTICWDYRGLYTSDPAADPTANTVAHQVDDLAEILEREGVESAVVVGWSMGVQVGFELVRRHRGLVRGLLAINGTSGRAFQTVMGSRVVGQAIPSLLRLVRAQAGLVGHATRLIAGSQLLVAAMVRAGLVAPTIDREIFAEVAAGFRTIDWTIYSDLLSRLDEHDAEGVLSTIAVPVGIVTGDGDLMTPPATAERLHRAIPGSRLVIIAGGTHYTPVEFPDVVVDELKRLLARVPGWERPAAPPVPADLTAKELAP